MRRLPLIAVLILALCSAALAVQKTTVSDTLYAGDGSPLNGTITLSANSTITASDGTVVPSGTKVLVTITNGVFSIDLVPNLTSTPTGTSYTATYSITPNITLKEIWVVPATGPVTLTSVRTAPAPITAAVLAMSQVNPPPNCGTNKHPQWTGTQWTCAGQISALAIEQPTTADSGRFQIKFSDAATLTRVSCDTDVGTVTLNLDVRSESTPNTAGAAVLSSNLICSATGVSSSSFAISAIAKETPLGITFTATSGAPGVVRIYVEH